MKLSDKQLSKTQRVCLFGSPKSGKTELVGGLSKDFNLLWFDLDNGFSTLKKLPTEQQDRIELISIPDTKTFPVAIETCLKVIAGVECRICEKHGKVTCSLCKKDGLPETRVCLSELQSDTIVVFDTGTQLANSAINNITKNQTDDYKFEWDDYRKQGTLMDKFLSQLQQANYNVVFITHETEVEMEDGKKKLVPIAGTANFSRNTAKYFDHVVYCDIKNKKHTAASSTLYSSTVLTGSRTDVVMETMEIPSLLDIFHGKVTPVIDRLAAVKAGADKLAALKGGGFLMKK